MEFLGDTFTKWIGMIKAKIRVEAKKLFLKSKHNDDEKEAFTASKKPSPLVFYI